MKKKNKDLLYNMEKQYQEQEYYLETDRRDVYYSALVKDIVKDNRTGQKLKCIFFCIICGVFVFTCVFGMFVVFEVAKKEQAALSDFGAIIAGLGSIVSSILVLPKIIAKHLFPENSEKERFEFITANQQFDLPKDNELDYFNDYDEENTNVSCFATNENDTREEEKAV